MVNVGIVGIGFMGVTHFKSMDRVKGGKVRAIVSSDPSKRRGDWRSIQGNFGGGGGRQDLRGVMCYAALEDLLADPGIDLVDICLPTHMHVEAGVQALNAGKHVLVEKPMAVDVDGAERLLRAAERVGRQVMVAHVLRFFPEFALIRRLSDQNEFGPVKGARFRRIISPPTWYDPGDVERVQSFTADLHIHDVDFVCHMFGLPRAVTSVGYTDKAGIIEHIDTQYHYGDGGPVVTAEGGWMVQQGCPFEHGYDIYFEQATLKFNSSWDPAPRLLTADGKVRKPRLSRRDGFASELQEAVNAVRTGEPSHMIDGRYGRDSLRLCLKEMRSVETGRRVPVQ